MAYEVSIVKCGSYEDEELRKAISESLYHFGGMESIVKKGDKVLIKLNLLASKEPERAVTTNPSFVKAIVRMVQEAGGIPVVGDSPGGRNTGKAYSDLLKRTGIQKVIDETGCGVVNFDESEVEITSDDARSFKKFTVAKAVLDADKVICLPKLKTHQLIYYTGAVKLLFGYITGLRKTQYHLNTGKNVDTFAELLMDIYVSLTPTINIMDAVVGMEGAGPQHGDPKKVGLVIASKSAPALDYVAASIIGFEPMIIPTVKNAFERSIGPGKISDIKVLGENPDSVKVPGFKKPETLMMNKIPDIMMGAANRLMGTRPMIRADKCKKCGKCIEGCPPKALSIKKGKAPVINYKKCIRCYCCQELCPEGAVLVKKPLISILLSK
jgi:uncharacterized protein (DUF362 family)/NAD-dependent dihydropyrimidine dehydrogenase PreA subunit